MFGNNDFIGISKEKLDNELIPEINKYITNIQDVISQFQSNPNVELALRGGAVTESLRNYLEAAKVALQDYVDKLTIEVQVASKAYEQWESGQKNVASGTEELTNIIRNSAAGFNLD